MLGARLSSIAASAILLLGSAAIALAQGGPPEELPDGTSHAQRDIQTFELTNETATSAVEDRGLDEHEGEGGEGDGATEFSRWVSENDLTGCQRGQTIARYARQGPHEFDPAQVTPVPEDELPGNCALGDDAEGADAGQGAGPPSHAGRPDHAGQPGPPAHAGQPGPPPHARGGAD